MSSVSQFLPIRSVRRLLRQNETDPRYRKRVRSQLVFSTLIEPLRWYERLRFGRRIRRAELAAPPLFLLGFGRSGTTHLHNLVWQDPGFGVVTNYQAAMHPIALMGRSWLPKLFAGRLPAKRPMDNVAITLEGPQEEEMAMINATHHAPLHFMSFPRAIPEMYDRYVCDLGKDRDDLEGWTNAYREVLNKATILSGGKRLVLKTPPNTGRIKVLTEMFPEARFVNIVRNPYRVYKSMLNMYRKILPKNVYQEFDWAAIDQWVVDAYVVLMQKYLDERKCIEPGHLIEIRYEDLDDDPIGVLRNVYGTLELGDFESVRPRFEEYLAGLGRFEKNKFDFTDEVLNTVNDNWGFAFDAFGYERVEPGGSLD